MTRRHIFGLLTAAIVGQGHASGVDLAQDRDICDEIHVHTSGALVDGLTQRGKPLEVVVNFNGPVLADTDYIEKHVTPVLLEGLRKHAQRIR